MFFPVKELLIDAATNPRIERRADGLVIDLPKASDGTAAPATLDGVLALRGEDGGERAFEISANPIPGVPAEGGIVPISAIAPAAPKNQEEVGSFGD